MAYGIPDAPPRMRPQSDSRTLIAAVDLRLGSLSPAARRVDRLNAAMRYALLAPGKRIRPLLTILCASELGADGMAALDAGCAIEMVHAASLVLDDLPAMDDATQRRGQPATHVAFGQDVAILASIGLLGRAFTTLSRATQYDPAVRARLVTILAEALGSDGLAGGQYEDLHGAERARSVDAILDVNHLKTGVLFVAATEMAGAVAGVGDDRIAEMRRFATHLGQAFQLHDDLNDGTACEGGSPEDAGRLTALSLLGADELRRRLDAHVTQGLAALRPDGRLATYVRQVFRERLPAPATSELEHARA